ncbi:MAG: hypothetical protein NVS1B1_14910 [Candidatus Limnocylindrales bacterium]
MGILELLIVILLLGWLFGFFGRGRAFARGPRVDTAGWFAGGNWVHILLVIVVILVILRLVS